MECVVRKRNISVVYLILVKGDPTVPVEYLSTTYIHIDLRSTTCSESVITKS